MKMAVYWYRKAAEQGNAKAQVNLGCCYENGEGVEKDMKQAAEWFRKAAEQGNTHAQFSLGSCYDGGLGIAKDHLEAIKWYRKVSDYYDSKLKERYDAMDAIELSEVCIIMGEYARAIEYLDDSRLETDKSARIQCVRTYLKTSALLAKGENAEAEIRCFDECLSTKPELHWDVTGFRIWLENADMTDSARKTITDLTDRIDAASEK